MDSSWLSETSSEIVNYLYEHITTRGDEETARAQASSSLQAALSKGIWITDLPANDFEPLENSPMAKEVSVFFLLPFFCDVKFVLLYHAPGYRFKGTVKGQLTVFV